jgi:hypothetical protein
MRSCYTKDTDKYIQEDYRVFISQVHISHMHYGHFMGRKYILKCTTSIVCNANSLYLLIAYLWRNWKYMKVINKTWLVLLKFSLWSAGPTLSTLINYPAQLCRTGYQPTVFRITHGCNILLLNLITSKEVNAMECLNNQFNFFGKIVRYIVIFTAQRNSI